jgi:uncharacterized protein YyaL (SSP411 family)
MAPIKEVAILGGMDNFRTQELIDVLWSVLRPYCVVAISDSPPTDGSPQLLHNRVLVNEKPTAYVCQNFICQLPTNSPTQFEEQLSPKQKG